jgi:hypothetical protein
VATVYLERAVSRFRDNCVIISSNRNARNIIFTALRCPQFRLFAQTTDEAELGQVGATRRGRRKGLKTLRLDQMYNNDKDEQSLLE